MEKLLMDEQKEIEVRRLNDDDYLTRVTSDVPLTCKVVAGNAGAGYFSRELINKMIIIMKRTKHNLTDIFISPEDSSDVRAWEDDTIIDPTTRREILQAGELGAGELGAVWNVTLHKRGCLTKTNKVYGFDFANDAVNAVCIGNIDRF
jgi:hypothetical protein